MTFIEIRLIIVRYSNKNQDKEFEHFLCAKGDIALKLCRDKMLEQYETYLIDALADESQNEPELGEWHDSIFKANPDVWKQHVDNRYYVGTNIYVSYEEKLVYCAE